MGRKGHPLGAVFRQLPGKESEQTTGSEKRPLPGRVAGRGSAVGLAGRGDSRQGRPAKPAPCLRLRASSPSGSSTDALSQSASGGPRN